VFVDRVVHLMDEGFDVAVRQVRAGRLQIVLAEFEPEPLPVHLVHVAGRMAPAKLRAFIDFATERLRREPVLRSERPSP